MFVAQVITHAVDLHPLPCRKAMRNVHSVTRLHVPNQAIDPRRHTILATPVLPPCRSCNKGRRNRHPAALCGAILPRLQDWYSSLASNQLPKQRFHDIQNILATLSTEFVKKSLNDISLVLLTQPQHRF